MSISAKDVLQFATFASAEDRLDRRIDHLDRKVRLIVCRGLDEHEARLDELEAQPKAKTWPGVFAVLALALSIVAVCVAVFG